MSEAGHAADMTEQYPVIAPVLPKGLPIDQVSPIVLAYVGDAVFEVYVRQHLVAGPIRKPHELHRAATRYVSAASQAKTLRRWMPILTEAEADMVRRGRNTKSKPPRHADPGEYRHATALECLVGYLFYKGERERLEQLMRMAFAPEPEAGEAPEAADRKEDQA